MARLRLQIDRDRFGEWLHSPERDTQITCGTHICATCPVALFLNDETGKALWRVSPSFAQLHATPEEVNNIFARPIAVFELPSWVRGFISRFDNARGEAPNPEHWETARLIFDELS